MIARHWFLVMCALSACALHLCHSRENKASRNDFTGSINSATQFSRNDYNTKKLKEVFDSLNVKPVFASSYRNSSRATSMYRQRISLTDIKSAFVGLITLGLGGIAGLASGLASSLSPVVKQKFNESLENRQSFQGIVTNVLIGISESLMTWVENSLDDVPSLPRLDAQECMKRTVCEAHNQPKKYGLLGLVLQLFFPPYTETEEPSKIVSKYQLAARYGRQENANCGAQYDGCMMNFLELMRALANLFLP